jgi:hypothetical protein
MKLNRIIVRTLALGQEISSEEKHISTVRVTQ